MIKNILLTLGLIVASFLSVQCLAQSNSNVTTPELELLQKQLNAAYQALQSPGITDEDRQVIEKLIAEVQNSINTLNSERTNIIINNDNNVNNSNDSSTQGTENNTNTSTEDNSNLYPADDCNGCKARIAR